MKLYVCLCSLLVTYACTSTLPPHLKLQMINIVFRHGDRIPLNFEHETYPNDPYINKTYFPIGFGGLTNKGKVKAFELGKFLRQRYDAFLKKHYLLGDIIARSTDVERTKMTLLLVLAGLYPTNNTKQKWHPTLDWQPIPIQYEKINEDFLLMPTGCPKFKKMVSEIQELPEVKKLSAEFESLWDKLSKLSGKRINNSKEAFRLYNTLTSQTSMSLPLPQWAEGLLNNETFLSSVALNIHINNYNVTLKKLNAGRLLKKMTDDMIAKQKRQLKEGKKIRLYSAHDYNVSAHLLALGVTGPQLPHYASAVILELYRRNKKEKNKYYVQVVYYKGRPDDVEILNIKNCSKNVYNMCEFKEYQELIKNVIPNDDNELDCCDNGLKNCSLQW